jgi:23S rRNA maturation-related 3'-5' exoribonuclease YhaM
MTQRLFSLTNEKGVTDLLHSDEAIDITDYVKSFDLQIKSRPLKILRDNGDYIWHNSPDQTVEISGEVRDESTSFFETLNKEQIGVVKMKTKGHFWFDRKQEADVVMTGIELKDNQIEATYKSMAITDLTDYGLAARFLRWLLRR